MKRRLIALTLTLALNVPAFANVAKLPVVKAPVAGVSAAAAGAGAFTVDTGLVKTMSLTGTLMLPAAPKLPGSQDTPNAKTAVVTPLFLPAPDTLKTADLKIEHPREVRGAEARGRQTPDAKPVLETTAHKLQKKNGELPDAAELGAFFDGAKEADNPLDALVRAWYEPSIYSSDNIRDGRYESVLSRAWRLLANRDLDPEHPREKRRIQLKNAMIRRIENRDPGTGRHSLRVGLLSGLIALKMGLTSPVAERIAWAATFHDFGKTEPAITKVINKPGKLDDDEFAAIKKHSLIGARMLTSLSGLPTELQKLAARIALEHHERLDGSGYPFGKRGRQIGLGGRIVAVVDVFDALMENRPYREGMTIEKAIEIMTREARGFDKRARQALLDVLAEGGFVAGKKDLKPLPKKRRLWSWPRARDV